MEKVLSRQDVKIRKNRQKPDGDQDSGSQQDKMEDYNWLLILPRSVKGIQHIFITFLELTAFSGAVGPA